MIQEIKQPASALSYGVAKEENITEETKEDAEAILKEEKKAKKLRDEEEETNDVVRTGSEG